MRLLWFCLQSSVIGEQKLAPLSQPMRNNWRRLHVFASNSAWFIILLTSVLTGRSDSFGFGFKTLD